MNRTNCLYDNKIAEIYNSIINNSYSDINQIGLLSGMSGVIYCTSFIKEIFGEKESKVKNIEKIFSIIESGDVVDNSYCSGLTGVGMMVQLLEQNLLLETDINECLDELDCFLSEVLMTSINNLNLDFLYGHLGIIFYLIKRLNKKPNIENVINQFINSTIHSADTHNDFLKWKFFNRIKRKYEYNISISHGICALILVLSKLKKIYFPNNEIDKLIEQAVGYVLEQQIDKDRYGSYFSYLAIESEDNIQKSRLGWCYGDLGIAITLWRAAEVINKEEWKNLSMEILLFAAEKRRDLAGNMVYDAGICHGSAGIGHIFYRMWKETHVQELKDAADYWFNITYKMSKFDNGLAGYKTWDNGKWVNDLSLLNGISGVVLALSTYHYDIHPNWDECLLIN